VTEAGGAAAARIERTVGSQQEGRSRSRGSFRSRSRGVTLTAREEVDDDWNSRSLERLVSRFLFSAARTRKKSKYGQMACDCHGS
jgi:hypothetical protein